MKDGEIKNKLSPAQVSVMLHKVTEPPYFGKYWDHFETGSYRCAACETPLFSSDEKFDSKTGWPSFKKPFSERDLQFKSEPGPDDKVEIRCKKCKSHLGYVIAGDTPYYRINSVCLMFQATPVAVVAAAVTDPSKKKTDVVIFPLPSETARIENPEPDRSWNMSSLITGALIGLIAGAGATALYFAPRSTPATTDTATSTSEVATSTDQLDSPTDTTKANAAVERTEPELPVENDPIVPDVVTPVPDTSTSTQ